MTSGQENEIHFDSRMWINQNYYVS
jgi:hypothetical protein